MLRRRFFSALPPILLIALAALSGCSDPVDAISCTHKRDCYAGEICLNGLCQLAENHGAPGSNQQDTGNNHSDRDSNASNGLNDSSGKDDENQSPDQCKAIISADSTPCRTGLEDGTDITGGFSLLPEGITFAGCAGAGGLDSFQAVDHEIRPTFCPGQKTFFILPLSPCRDAVYTTKIRFESRDPLCELADLVDITFDNAPNQGCHELERIESCFIKTQYDDGALEWTIFSDPYTDGYSQRPWEISLGLHIMDLTNFPYSIHVQVSAPTL